MSTKRAKYDVEFKALSDKDEEQGRFEALVSVFGNEDSQGDRVLEGAFKNSLAQWQASGHPIPIIWSHQWGNPEAHLGGAEPGDVVEVPGRGLKVAGTIDLEDRFGAKVYKLLKTGLVKEFSFGYSVRKQRRGKDGVNELVELDLIEVGPTLVGANPSTQLLSIKADLEEAAMQDGADADIQARQSLYTDNTITTAPPGIRVDYKAGRSISAKNEGRIKAIIEIANELLASVGGADEETAEDADEAKVKAEEPKVVDPGLLELQAQIMQLKE